MSLAKPSDGDLADVEVSKPKETFAHGNGVHRNGDDATADSNSKLSSSGRFSGQLSKLYSGIFHDGLVRCSVVERRDECRRKAMKDNGGEGATSSVGRCPFFRHVFFLNFDIIKQKNKPSTDKGRGRFTPYGYLQPRGDDPFRLLGELMREKNEGFLFCFRLP